MVVAKIRYEEGSYEGDVNEGKVPEGKGVFEYRYPHFNEYNKYNVFIICLSQDYVLC